MLLYPVYIGMNPNKPSYPTGIRFQMLARLSQSSFKLYGGFKLYKQEEKVKGCKKCKKKRASGILVIAKILRVFLVKLNLPDLFFWSKMSS